MYSSKCSSNDIEEYNNQNRGSVIFIRLYPKQETPDR